MHTTSDRAEHPKDATKQVIQVLRDDLILTGPAYDTSTCRGTPKKGVYHVFLSVSVDNGAEYDNKSVQTVSTSIALDGRHGDAAASTIVSLCGHSSIIGEMACYHAEYALKQAISATSVRAI